MYKPIIPATNNNPNHIDYTIPAKPRNAIAMIPAVTRATGTPPFQFSGMLAESRRSLMAEKAK